MKGVRGAWDPRVPVGDIVGEADVVAVEDHVPLTVRDGVQDEDVVAETVALGLTLGLALTLGLSLMVGVGVGLDAIGCP